jgi:hypothetical protein
MVQVKGQYLEYALLVVGALLLYFGFLSESCGCYKKMLYSFAVAIPLLIITLLRLK